MSSGEWAIGIRGFNDEFSNKLLVLVDGRSVYNEFYTGVFWDTLNLSVDDIERIEVIRGPGAAMWGTNAVNGVVNIITKSAKSTKGALVSGSAGSGSIGDATLRYGSEGSGAAFRVTARDTSVEPFSLFGGSGPSRGWMNRNANFRLDWDLSASDSLQVSGGMYRSGVGLLVPNGTIASPSAPPADDQVVSSGGNVLARWRHIFSETDSIDVRFSYQHAFRNDPQTGADVNTLDYGFEQHKRLGSRQEAIWGLTFREDGLLSTPTPALRLNPLTDHRDVIALFAQDEIALIPDKLQFIAGAQVSHTENIGYAIQPTARILWTPTTTLSTWIAASRAERTPSLDDRGLDYYETPTSVPSGSPLVPPLWAVAHVTGNPAARFESVLAYEAGQRFQIDKKIYFDLSSFYNVYRHLISDTTGVPQLAFFSGMPYLLIPVTTGNDRHGESYGAEVAPTWSVTSRWRLTGGYSWLRVETRPYGGAVNLDQFRTNSATPHHQWELGSYWDVTPKVQIDCSLYYHAAMLQTGIPQHLRGDLRIGWRPTAALELSVGVQDAFQANHLEYESTRFNQVAEIPRNVYGKVTWRF